MTLQSSCSRLRRRSSGDKKLQLTCCTVTAQRSLSRCTVHRLSNLYPTCCLAENSLNSLNSSTSLANHVMYQNPKRMCFGWFYDVLCILKKPSRSRFWCHTAQTQPKPASSVLVPCEAEMLGRPPQSPAQAR